MRRFVLLGTIAAAFAFPLQSAAHRHRPHRRPQGRAHLRGVTASLVSDNGFWVQGYGHLESGTESDGTFTTADGAPWDGVITVIDNPAAG